MTDNQGLFPLLLGSEWQLLSTPVQGMHGHAERLVARGVADVGGSPHWIVRFLRRQLGLPMPGPEQAVEITIERRGTHERWSRQFASRRMRSTLRPATRAPFLSEQLGIITLRCALIRDHDAIDWQWRGARLFGLPVPRFFFGKVMARCGSENGRYTFEIDTRLPLLGQMVAYRGWLEIIDES